MSSYSVSNNAFIITTLKVYQLKDICRLYFDEEHPELKVRYKSKNKIQILGLITQYQIDLKLYRGKYITELPSKNLLKKYSKKPYTLPEQTLFLEEEKQKEDNYIEDEKKTDAMALIVRQKVSDEDVILQAHQVKFIKQFVYSNLHGAIMFHGVGSGKTLTAVVSSYWYLKLYPSNRVIVISPSALIYNFVEGMLKYGLDIQDNRYVFTTYEKYVRMSMKNKNAKNCLLIVDEAHNCRTEMKIFNITNPDTEEVIGSSSVGNKRGFNILEYGAKNSHKILLLTGTAFVNGIYDIENLLAMIDKREPLQRKTFDNALGSPSNITDYFSYRISYYPSPKSIDFPERKEKFIYLEMSEKMEKQYSNIKNNSVAKNVFLIDERRASNFISLEGETLNPKIKWCVDEIVKVKQKFIIYAGLFDFGIGLLEKALTEHKINYVKITGRENQTQKEQNKQFYNEYDPNSEMFNCRVLLISRAGAEGVDTKNTQNIILLDHQWNDALSEQIIARAIRYKSHHSLPAKDRYVNVYRLFLCSKDSKELFEKVKNGNVDFTVLNSEMKESVKKQQEIQKAQNEEYLPTIKLLKTLKIGDTDRPYIPEKNVWGKVREGYNKKMVDRIQEVGWEEYAKLDNDEERKEWRTERYSEWFVLYSPDRKKKENIMGTVDLKLYILCQAKLANITTFISYFGNSIKLFESFESVFLKKIIEAEKNGKMTDKQQSIIYNKLLKNEKDEVKKLLFENRTRTTQEKLQQYYTPIEIANLLVENSKIKDVKTHIRILEPTAGDGGLIIPLTNLVNIDFTLDVIELDKDNRKKLKEITNGRNFIHLNSHRNFLTYISGGVYDFIFMNPPFHLRKGENRIMLRDVYDVDFVERAYAMLKVGGKLMGIIGNSFDTLKDERTIWLKSHCKPKRLETKKYSGVLISNTYMIEIVKKNNNEDKDILNKKFYKTTDLTLGTEIENGEVSLEELKTEATEKLDKY
jgi:tRNA1(Val) A37 N6-methylase TrmN6